MSRRNKHETSKPSQAAEQAPKPSQRRLWLVLLVCLVGSTAVSYVVFKHFVTSIPQELIGTWQVTEGRLRGATLEFRSDGTAVAVLTRQGKKEITHSTVKVEGKKIYMTDRDDRGKVETVSQTIVKLADDLLILRDEENNTFRMKRILD